MKLEVKNEKQNELFNRKEVEAVIVADITPSREQVLEILSKQFSTDQETIKIKGIHGKFGTHEFHVDANIYDSKQAKDQIELKKKKESEAEKKKVEAAKAEEEAKKAAEAPAEEPKEEAPAEQPAEVKEEPKAEETKSEEKTE